MENSAVATGLEKVSFHSNPKEKKSQKTAISGKLTNIIDIRSDQIRSVAQSCPTLCDPMNRSMPGLPVHHHLPEFTETHVHRVGDAI